VFVLENTTLEQKICRRALFPPLAPRTPSTEPRQPVPPRLARAYSMAFLGATAAGATALRAMARARASPTSTTSTPLVSCSLRGAGGLARRSSAPSRIACPVLHTRRVAVMAAAAEDAPPKEVCTPSHLLALRFAMARRWMRPGCTGRDGRMCSIRWVNDHAIGECSHMRMPGDRGHVPPPISPVDARVAGVRRRRAEGRHWQGTTKCTAHFHGGARGGASRRIPVAPPVIRVAPALCSTLSPPPIA
jgi:hypothetical protein